MGMFSWKTADTNESISNIHSTRPIRGVYLLQPNNQPPIYEPAYHGYGEFGHVDAYVWLCEMNSSHFGINTKSMSREEMREVGIELFFERNDKLLYPLKFSFNSEAVYEGLPASEDCELQGFFYDDELFEEDNSDEDEYLMSDHDS